MERKRRRHRRPRLPLPAPLPKARAKARRRRRRRRRGLFPPLLRVFRLHRRKGGIQEGGEGGQTFLSSHPSVRPSVSKLELPPRKEGRADVAYTAFPWRSLSPSSAYLHFPGSKGGKWEEARSSWRGGGARILGLRRKRKRKGPVLRSKDRGGGKGGG